MDEKTYEHNLIAQIYCYFRALGFEVVYFSVYETKEGSEGYDIGFELKGYKKIGLQVKRPVPNTRRLSWELKKKQYDALFERNQRATKDWLFYAFPTFKDKRLLSKALENTSFASPKDIKIDLSNKRTARIGSKDIKKRFDWSSFAIDILICIVGKTIPKGMHLEELIRIYSGELFELTAMIIVNPEKLKVLVLSHREEL